MKFILHLSSFILCLAAPAIAGVDAVNLLIHTNGQLIAPTNFWTANVGSITGALAAAGYTSGGGSATNLPAGLLTNNQAGVTLTGTFNGADAAGAAAAATNTLTTSGFFSVMPNGGKNLDLTGAANGGLANIYWHDQAYNSAYAWDAGIYAHPGNSSGGTPYFFFKDIDGSSNAAIMADSSQLTGTAGNMTIPGANVSGTLPSSALPAGVVTNTSDAQMAAQEIANAAQLGNLVDFVSFCTGEMTNTYRGQRVYQTGQAGCQQLSGRGAYFTGYGSLMIPVNVQPSNTIVIVWNPGFTNLSASFGFTTLFQLLNTNNGDCEYANYDVTIYGQTDAGWLNFFLASNNVTFPLNAAQPGTANLMQYNNPLGGFSYSWLHMRHVTVISTDGSGNVTFWDNGQAGQWYTGSTASLAFGNFPHTSMNALSIGGYYLTNGITGGVTNGYYGTLESVFLFNGPANTNLVQSTLYASDWIQPFAAKDFWIGDSLCGQQSFYTNSLPDMAEAWRHDAVYYDFIAGGTYIKNYGVLTNWLSLQKPHGKIQLNRILVAGGINDIYGGGYTGAQVFAGLTNDFLATELSDPRYELDVFGVFQTWTNALGGNYPQTSVGLTAVQTYNQACATNRSIVKHFYDRYAFAPQSLLTTNAVPRYSLLGLHFDDPTNGLAAYQSVNLGSFICEQTGFNPFTLTTDQFYMDWGGRMVGGGTNGIQIYGSAGNVETAIGPAGISGKIAAAGSVAWPSNTWNLVTITNGLLPGAIFEANSNGAAKWTGLMGSGTVTWLQHLP